MRLDVTTSLWTPSVHTRLSRTLAPFRGCWRRLAASPDGATLDQSPPGPLLCRTNVVAVGGGGDGRASRGQWAWLRAEVWSSRGGGWGGRGLQTGGSAHNKPWGSRRSTFEGGQAPGATAVVTSRERSPVPALARDILRYFSLFGAPSLAPAVAIAKAEAADRALRLLSSSRQEVMTTPLL